MPVVVEEKTKLSVNLSQDKQKLEDLEATILSTLKNAQGNILDDVALLQTLQKSKVCVCMVSFGAHLHVWFKLETDF